MNSIYCDAFFCYGAHDGGYLSKIYKNDSIITFGNNPMCSSGMDADWIITDAQVCDAVNVNTGTGIIYINPLGNLTLINSANVTCSGLQVNRQGDSVFVYAGPNINVY